MSLDERLRTDLAAAANPISAPTDALARARRLGQRRKRRRQTVLGAAMAAVVVLGGLVTWRTLGTESDRGGVLIADQPTPGPDATPATVQEPDPVVQARITSAPISRRLDPVAVWTGEEVVIWGGTEDWTIAASGQAPGAIYDPATDAWASTPAGGVGKDAPGVWTGEALVVVGGLFSCGICDSESGFVQFVGPQFVELSADHPNRLGSGAGTDLPSRLNVEALWTGDRVLIWGGFIRGALDAAGFADGGVYDPELDAWESIPDNPFRQGGRAITAFHNNALIVGSGEGWAGGFGAPNPEAWARYSLDTGEWTGIPDPPVTTEPFAAGVQVGDKLVVFNGDVGNPLVKGSGAILNLTTDTWVELAGPPDRPDMVDGVAIGNRAVFLAPETGALLIYDLDLENWTTWDSGDETLVGARTLVQAGDTEVLAWNGTTGEGVIVDVVAREVIPTRGAETASGQVSDTDRRLVTDLIAFAQDSSANSVLDRFSDTGVGFTLADRVFYFTGTAEQLEDPAFWAISEPRGFAEFSGPFSPLESLARLSVDGSDWKLTVDEYNWCAGPPRTRPPGTEGLRQLNIQPTETLGCIDWFAVDLYMDDTGAVVAVRLDLFGP